MVMELARLISPSLPKSQGEHNLDEWTDRHRPMLRKHTESEMITETVWTGSRTGIVFGDFSTL